MQKLTREDILSWQLLPESTAGWRNLAVGYSWIALWVLGNYRGYPDMIEWVCFRFLPQAPASDIRAQGLQWRENQGRKKKWSYIRT